MRDAIGHDVRLDSPLTERERSIISGVLMGLWPDAQAGIDYARKVWGWD
jgi:hypothetical protein|tara:strand:+ start:50 stop:196 length:147 start_codon:yes stop_codon:yes gene_type:complete